MLVNSYMRDLGNIGMSQNWGCSRHTLQCNTETSCTYITPLTGAGCEESSVSPWLSLHESSPWTRGLPTKDTLWGVPGARHICPTLWHGAWRNEVCYFTTVIMMVILNTHLLTHSALFTFYPSFYLLPLIFYFIKMSTFTSSSIQPLHTTKDRRN